MNCGGDCWAVAGWGSAYGNADGAEQVRRDFDAFRETAAEQERAAHAVYVDRDQVREALTVARDDRDYFKAAYARKLADEAWALEAAQAVRAERDAIAARVETFAGAFAAETRAWSADEIDSIDNTRAWFCDRMAQAGFLAPDWRKATSPEKPSPAIPASLPDLVVCDGKPEPHERAYYCVEPKSAPTTPASPGAQGGASTGCCSGEDGVKYSTDPIPEDFRTWLDGIPKRTLTAPPAPTPAQDRVGWCVGHLGPPPNTADPHPRGETCSDWREGGFARPSQPPIDNEHIAPGCEPFDEATIAANRTDLVVCEGRPEPHERGYYCHDPKSAPAPEQPAPQVVGPSVKEGT